MTTLRAKAGDVRLDLSATGVRAHAGNHWRVGLSLLVGFEGGVGTGIKGWGRIGEEGEKKGGHPRMNSVSPIGDRKEHGVCVAWT